MIDLDFLREQCGQSEELMQQMLDLFIQTGPSHIAQIKEALSNQNPDGVAKSVHAFLSSLKILNAERAVQLGMDIESHLVKGGDLVLVQDQIQDLLDVSKQLLVEAQSIRF